MNMGLESSCTLVTSSILLVIWAILSRVDHGKDDKIYLLVWPLFFMTQFIKKCLEFCLAGASLFAVAANQKSPHLQAAKISRISLPGHCQIHLSELNPTSVFPWSIARLVFRSSCSLEKSLMSGSTSRMVWIDGARGVSWKARSLEWWRGLSTEAFDG